MFAWGLEAGQEPFKPPLAYGYGVMRAHLLAAKASYATIMVDYYAPVVDILNYLGRAYPDAYITDVTPCGLDVGPR